MARKGKTESLSQWTILLVDDDPDYRESTARQLEREGHAVLQAENGIAALALLKNEQVDLLLLDYFMPGMTGKEVVIELRKFNPYVQIILQTGYASEQPQRELLRRLDIQGYHDKSEGPEKLLLWTDIGLKAAQTVQLLYKSQQNLHRVLDTTFELHKIQTLDKLLQHILSQLTSMIGAADAFLAVLGLPDASGEHPLCIKACTGSFQGHAEVAAVVDAATHASIRTQMKSGEIVVQDKDASIPLLVGDDALGIIYIDGNIKHDYDVELLRIFANQAALAIQNASMYEQAQQQLLQSEKLASIGQLAAGVAHEINNPIGYVHSNFGTLEQYHQSLFEMLRAYEEASRQMGSSEACLMLDAMRTRLELDFLLQDIPVLMSESREGLSRVQKIVQDLKCFSRVDSSQVWQQADLHDGIDSTLNIVNNEVKYVADIVKEYGDLPEIECLPSQINQVALNLVVNAAQAMGPQRGRITIRTGAEGDSVWFEVEDTGSGIPKEILARIFDPFFTTKPVGKGTGLGLSLSYGIVQKHHGRFEVRSEPGVGTTFRVTLPVRQPHSAVAEPQ